MMHGTHNNWTIYFHYLKGLLHRRRLLNKNIGKRYQTKLKTTYKYLGIFLKKLYAYEFRATKGCCTSVIITKHLN